MIIDSVAIHLKAGKGGDGCSSFINRKGRRIGYGGDGSRGANIILKVSPHIYDLSKFKARKISARDGSCGMENNRSGKTPDDLILNVPRGTIVRDGQGNIIFDMSATDSMFVPVRGGKPGRGNYKRRRASVGEPGEEKDIVLDYRIPNDAAILGMPNSGKTSLFNAITGKHFKTGGYPFTTTSCMWGQFEFKLDTFTVMDTPALIDESHKGRGVGSYFLKHLYRTKIIIITADAGGNYENDFKVVREQVKRFNISFINKKVFYLLTKADKIKKKGEAGGLLSVSVNDSMSVERLKEAVYRELVYEKNSDKSGQ